MQWLLLRFLETGEIQCVGSDSTSSVDVRIIAATNRNLRDMIAQRTFREDLFHRLNVIHIHVPPLRERREDIPVLLEYLLRQSTDSHHVDIPRVDEEAAAQLAAADWLGNARQLRNVVERLVVSVRTGVITTADLALAGNFVNAGSQRPWEPD
jgi:two-component system response regulator AtoC